MQQTEKYHFSIIDPSDDFSPEKLNRNAQQLEDELLRYETAVDQRLTGHEAAVTAALSRHKSDTDAALARQAETVVQCREENCLFKLGGPTALPADGDITFSLSGVDMSQYAALLLVYTVYQIRTSPVLYFNGQEVMTLLTTGSMAYGATACSMIMQHLNRNRVASQTLFLDGLGEYSKAATSGGAAEGVDWNGITSLKLTNVDFAILYGLKQ